MLRIYRTTDTTITKKISDSSPTHNAATTTTPSSSPTLLPKGNVLARVSYFGIVGTDLSPTPNESTTEGASQAELDAEAGRRIAARALSVSRSGRCKNREAQTRVKLPSEDLYRRPSEEDPSVEGKEGFVKEEVNGGIGLRLWDEGSVESKGNLNNRLVAASDRSISMERPNGFRLNNHEVEHQSGSVHVTKNSLAGAFKPTNLVLDPTARDLLVRGPCLNRISVSSRGAGICSGKTKEEVSRSCHHPAEADRRVERL